MSELFLLTEAQMARLAPLLPSDTRGVPRVDDRCVISGIVHVLRSGCRWSDAPQGYGPCKTLYNRFVRWAAKGVWERVFLTLAAAGGPPTEVLLDSSMMKAHRCAAGGKGGARAGDWHQPRRTHHQAPRSHRRARTAARVPADRRSGGRLPRGRAARRITSAACSGDRGSRLRQQPGARRGQCPRRNAEHPAQGQSPFPAAV